MRSSQLVILKNNNLSLFRCTDDIRKCDKNLALFLAFLLAPFLCVTEAHANISEWLGPSGSLRVSYWNEDKTFTSDHGFAGHSAWLSLRPPEFFESRVFVEGFVQGQDTSRHSRYQGDLREGFIERSFGAVDVKLGRQIIVWGRADKMNPTDSFSARNQTLLATDDEDQRLGHLAAQVMYNFENLLENLKLIAIWQPEWRESTFPLKSESSVVFRHLRPDESQKQFGLKLDQSGGDIDWSLSYFDGFNRTPDLKVLGAGQLVELGFDYGRIQVWGADFAKNIGEYGLRGELAYVQTRDGSGENPLQQNSNIQAVAGVDRSFIENLNVNVQALYKGVQNFADPNAIADSNARTLGQRLAAASNQSFRDQMGVTVRPSYKMLNETLELEVAYVSWFRSADSLTRPKITYAISDDMKLIAGAEFFNGPQDSLFGQLKDASGGFAEFRLLF